jgi:hypothetical protein
MILKKFNKNVSIIVFTLSEILLPFFNKIIKEPVIVKNTPI